jgi:hypothetical protein
MERQMMEKIMESDIEAAALAADVDAALLPLMRTAGISTGDVAAQAFSGFDWATADAKARIQQINAWLKLEKLYAPDTVDFDALAKDALPIQVFPDPPHERDGGDDWGSKRQIDAQNRFTDAVIDVLSPEAAIAYDDYCLKATTEEIIEEGLRLVKAALA